MNTPPSSSPPSKGGLVPWESPKVSELTKLRQNQKQKESMKPIIGLIFYSALILLASLIPSEYLDRVNFIGYSNFSKWLIRIEYITCVLLLLIAVFWGYYKHILKNKRFKAERAEARKRAQEKYRDNLLRTKRSKTIKDQKMQYLSPQERKLLGIGEFGNEEELVRSMQFSGDKKQKDQKSIKKKTKKKFRKKDKKESEKDSFESTDEDYAIRSSPQQQRHESMPDAAKYAQLTPPISNSIPQSYPSISSYNPLTSSFGSQYPPSSSYPTPSSASSSSSLSPHPFYKKRNRSIFTEPITDEKWIDERFGSKSTTPTTTTATATNSPYSLLETSGDKEFEPVPQQPSFSSQIPSESLIDQKPSPSPSPSRPAYGYSSPYGQTKTRKTWEDSISPLSPLSSPSPMRSTMSQHQQPLSPQQHNLTGFSSIQPQQPGFNTSLSLSRTTTTSPGMDTTSPLYQHSLQQLSSPSTPYRISPSPRVKSPKDKAKTAAGNNTEAMKVLDEFGISQYADKWVENIRKWIGSFILIPLMKKIQELDSHLKENGLEPYTCDHALSETLPASAGVPPVPIPPGRQLTLLYVLNSLATQQQQQQQQQQFRMSTFGQQQQQQLGNSMLPIQSKLAKYRCNLEVYLDIPNCPRDYLLERLKSLSQDGYLAQFRWNGGQEYKGSAWDSKKLPTDAHIVMHLFFAYFDLLSKGSTSSDTSKGFTSRHLINSNEKEKLKSSSTYILESQKTPPHYQAILSGKNVEVLQGRNNVFHAMLLFIYHVIKEYDGFIDQIDLSTIFGDVIENDF